MSVKATNFVRRIRGLSPGEKCVAFVLADHTDHKGGGSFASMTTVAEEAGLAHRQNASEYVQSLENKGIIFTREKSKGGKPTIWHFNYDMEDSASVRIVPLNRSPQVAVNRSPQVAVTAVELAPNCSPSGTSTAAQTDENTPSTAVQGLQEGLEARVLKSKGESSSRVADAPKSDDDLKFEKAKSELLARELGNRVELAEAMDLVKERSSTNGGEPILNWQSYLEKSLKGFTDADWAEARARIERRRGPSPADFDQLKRLVAAIKASTWTQHEIIQQIKSVDDRLAPSMNELKLTPEGVAKLKPDAFETLLRALAGLSPSQCEVCADRDCEHQRAERRVLTQTLKLSIPL
jgi:hypothetical protein